MIFAQLTDIHIRSAGALVCGKVDTLSYLRRAIQRLNELKPEFVLITGDLVDLGGADEYEIACTELDRLDAPYHPIPGNHDGKVFWSTFADRFEHVEPGIGHTFERGGVRFVMLDTSVPEQSGGDITIERAEWLRANLTPGCVLALHHPPFETGIAHMDAIGLAHSERLADAMINRRPRVILAGHVHRTIHAVFEDVPAMIAPSCAHAVTFDMSSGGPSTFQMDPPAVAMHRITESGLVSHTVFIAQADGPYPFFDEDGLIR